MNATIVNESSKKKKMKGYYKKNEKDMKIRKNKNERCMKSF